MIIRTGSFCKACDLTHWRDARTRKKQVPRANPGRCNRFGGTPLIRVFLLDGARVIKHEFEQGGPLQHLLLLYTQALIAQMAQTAVCNRHHSLDKQLCRWLLLSLDRLRSGELTMTQELIANMLGVRRQGVAEAAGNLQKAGLIDYHRGHISVLDRPGLETRVCECYAVVKREYDRLLPA